MLDKKRVFIVVIAIILIIAIIIGVYFIIKNREENNEITEYIPEQEITDEQLRQTIVSLYFKNENGLMPEARLVDVKELINNPYEKIMNMLLEGPKNENLQKTIPGGTKINSIEKQGEILILDFSEEFISNHSGGEQEEKLTLQSIVKTVTELTEINGIKIKINGEENKEFKDSLPIETEYRPIWSNGKITLLEVHLITGRTHQIRAHLASQNHPIIGDYKYGIKRINDSLLIFRK